MSSPAASPAWSCPRWAERAAGPVDLDLAQHSLSIAVALEILRGELPACRQRHVIPALRDRLAALPMSRYRLSVICQSPLMTARLRRETEWICSGKMRPARLERATSWFVAVNTFVDPAQLTGQKGSQTARHLDPILDPTRPRWHGATRRPHRITRLPRRRRSGSGAGSRPNASAHVDAWSPPCAAATDRFHGHYRIDIESGRATSGVVKSHQASS
jgi:hypothetical protein